MSQFLFALIFPFVFSQEAPFNSYKAILDLAEKNLSLSRTQLLTISVSAMKSKGSQHQKDCKTLKGYMIEAQRSLVTFLKSPAERNGFQKSEYVSRYKEMDKSFTEIFASQKTACPSQAPKEELRRSRSTQA
jgi:hypothetical protein